MTVSATVQGSGARRTRMISRLSVPARSASGPLHGLPKHSARTRLVLRAAHVFEAAGKTESVKCAGSSTQLFISSKIGNMIQ
ncbi:hypothetical protein PsYK624_078480 [Phanerochaete sordida]|uniref:Uncharacterized protein n=1 Tax=Phanerochaete sordida TaxID=48140 RepID=A0A9P3G973_9APHY|nr:hypothetical protein PsYK624_078480 [Phanerochaete sordida]